MNNSLAIVLNKRHDYFSSKILFGHLKNRKMKKVKINRRDFIRTSAFASIPLALSGFPLFAASKSRSSLFDADNDKVLVLVQLQGGNDGLSTIYHNAQYANLKAVRGNIMLPENSIINFHKEYGFHSAMQGMKDVWEMGSLGIVQNVGYPNQNRSHFRSADIWNSASSAEEFDSTGWIGRFYDLNYSDYPNGYPNKDNPHPFALTMGKIVSETCQGVSSNYSLSLLDPFNPGTALVSAEGDIPANCFGDALSFVNDTVSQTNAFASVISYAANAGNNVSKKWNSLETELAEKLKNVARLISGGLQTKIYVVQMGGFDTHDNQVVDGVTTTGKHDELLRELSDAICAFQDDLNLLNISDRVIGMTYSEFGRRIRSNAALGTDHGTAAPLFLFGSCIASQILGDHPEIDTQVGIDEGVPMQYDFRDIYGTVLRKWLGLNEDDVSNVIHPEVKTLPLFKSGCVQTTSVLEEYGENEFQIELYPNPTSSYLHIDFSAMKGRTTVRVFDGKGGVMHTFKVEGFSSQNQISQLNVSNYPPGAYFIHIENRGIHKTKKFIKI